MKKQTPSYYDNAHNYRRQAVHSLFLVLIGIIAFIAAIGCRAPKVGCPNMADLESHKYDSQYAWLYGVHTQKLIVIDKKTGETVCAYKVK